MAKPATSIRPTVTLETLDEDGCAIHGATKVKYLNGHRLVTVQNGGSPLHLDGAEGSAGMSAQRCCREVYRDLLHAIIDPASA